MVYGGVVLRLTSYSDSFLDEENCYSTYYYIFSKAELTGVSLLSTFMSPTTGLVGFVKAGCWLS